MDKRATILDSVSSALASGTISRGDLESILDRHTKKTAGPATQQTAANHLSTVDSMFYIAGIVLFAAIAALVSQTWDSGPAVRIFLSAGSGALLWAVALFFLVRPKETDIKDGMTNALLLAGSLSIISGGFIIANEYTRYGDISFYVIALTLATLGIVHIGFSWHIRRDLLLFIGILLSVASLPALIFGILDGSGAPMFIYCLAVAASGGFLAYATRIIARLGASNGTIGRVFDPLGAFIVLMSLYTASYDTDTGLLWLLILIIGIIGLFYLSIVIQDRLLLGNGSLFLVLAIITISFRYFSDNVAISLLISAAGLLGTAVMAASINRRYITQPL